MFKNLVLKNRSYRRFNEQYPISMDTLKEISSIVRYVPSTANLQALKLMLINNPEDNAHIFDTLGWAAKLKDWSGPKKGERPSAYIVILCDLKLGKNFPIDDGIVAQTLLLNATYMGYGGCMLGNINREKLSQYLKIDTTNYKIDLVIALGKPKEEIILEDLSPESDSSYYRDKNDIHHVPKRSLDELLIFNDKSIK